MPLYPKSNKLCIISTYQWRQHTLSRTLLPGLEFCVLEIWDTEAIGQVTNRHQGQPVVENTMKVDNSLRASRQNPKRADNGLDEIEAVSLFPVATILWFSCSVNMLWMLRTQSHARRNAPRNSAVMRQCNIATTNRTAIIWYPDVTLTASIRALVCV